MCIPSSCHGSGTPVMTRIHHLMGLSPLVVGATQQWSNFGVTSPSAVSILSSHLSQELTVFVMAKLMWNQPIVAELFYALKNTRAHIYREPAIAADELVLVCVYLVTRLQYALHCMVWLTPLLASCGDVHAGVELDKNWREPWRHDWTPLDSYTSTSCNAHLFCALKLLIIETSIH